MTSTESPAPEVAVDNDVILKAACYGVSSLFWSEEESAAIGILGAAPYVIRSRIRRMALTRAADGALADLDALLTRSAVLEPTDAEVRLAADLEVTAARRGLDLDAGESQLAAIAATRAMRLLESGDKRGIRGLDAALDEVAALVALEGKVRCLEQIVQQVITDEFLVASMTSAVCGEPAVDKALTACFACHSPGSPSRDDVLVGLDSYIRDLRRSAPRILMA